MKKMRRIILLCFMVATLTLCCFMTACGETAKIVELDKSTATVEVGSDITLKGTVAGVELDEIVWASDKTAVATVVKGVVRGVSAGVATISASIGDSVAKCVVTVKPVITISVEPTELTLVEGKTATLVPTISGVTGAATWKSDKTSVATVSDSGLVTAVSAGSATITASIGGKTATCVVTVTGITITLDKTTLALLDDGVTATLTADLQNTTDAVVWSSSADAIATVSDAGVVTPVSVGEATITATVSGKTATCVVTVSAVTITIDETANIFMTRTKQLTADMGGYAGVVAWSSSADTIATVSDTGLVTPVSVGTATITATMAGKTDTCAVTVKAAPTVTLNKVSTKLDFSGITDSKTATVVATVSDETEPLITWTSSAAGVATVVGGVITARSEGKAVITADFDGFTAVCNVVVKDYTGYTLIQTPNQFKNIANDLGRNYVLANDINFSNKHIECIGNLSGILDGNGYSVSNFIIGAKSAEDFAIEEGKLWSDNPFKWKGLFGENNGTIKNIAFIDTIGYFPGNECGLVTQMNYGTIENVLLMSEINFLNGSTNVGGIAGTNGGSGKIKNCIVIASSTIGHKGMGEQDNNKDKKWGKVSQGMIAGRFASGEIKNCYTASKPTAYTNENLFGGNMVGLGRKAGDAEYKQLVAEDKCANKTLDELKAAALFADGWNNDIWNIVDTELPTLKNDAKTAPTIVEFLDTNGIFVNNQLTIQAVVNTTDTVTYSSGDATIATIDSATGVITALKPGTVTITATAGGKTDTIDLPINLVWSDLTAKRLKEGANETLVYEATTDAVITWKSSDDKIAMVDTGVVAAISDGNVKIIATINGVEVVLNTISCFTVKISLDKTTAEVFIGDTITLIATTEETTENVVWDSSDKLVATVDNAGVITVLKVGFINITATVEGKVATCALEVRAVPQFKLNKTTADLYIVDGKAETLALSIIPDTVGETITAAWTTSDDTKATVSDKGVVTAVAVGTVKIRATVDKIYYRETTITVIAAKGIDTAAKFKAIKTALNDNYVLTADIDLAAEHIDGLGNLTGTLNGRGHSVSNFIIGAKSPEDFTKQKDACWDGATNWKGLFGVNEGTIKNIAFTGAKGYFSGKNCGLIAQVNSGTIENVLLDVEINYIYASYNVGGIALLNEGAGKITNCVIIASSTIGHKGLGGKEDENHSWGRASQGMIVGRYASGEIKNCYTASKPTSYTSDMLFGGNMVGLGRGKSTPNDPEYKQLVSADNCANKTIEELKTATLFGDSWDKDVWNIVEGSQPTLKLC